MAFTTIPADDVDAKSPIDDTLMGEIKADLDDLNTRVLTAGNTPFIWEIYGKLNNVRSFKRSLAYGLVNKEFTPSICRFMLKKSGTSGTIAFDIRRHTQPKTPITAISHQYNAGTVSIAQTGAAINTQSIARSTTQISTQSITHAKAAINVSSIINIGGNYWQYNLASALDSDTIVGDYITTASCSSGGNNGTFAVTEVGRSGGANFVVYNASGVAQTAAAGTAQVKIMSYNFTNPVDTEFSAGEAALFASHTSGANDGTLTIYKVNQSGNNIWVKHSTGATQGGAAGSVDCNRWKYAYSSTVDVTLYIVGEKAKMASHTSGNNDGSFVITSVNSSGNNIVVYNSAGVVQGGAAGTANTNRWTYAMPSDPSAQINVGDTVYFSGHTNPLNDGTFTVKEVNRSASNNLVVYNLSGVAQGGTAGNTYTTKKLIQFASDMSASYTTDSYIEMSGCASNTYNQIDTRAPFKVLEVNRGGGSAYNVVIDNPTGPAQTNPAGYVQTEMKSIFTSAPSLASDVTGLTPNQNLTGSSSSLIATAISANTPIMVYITSVMLGDPRDLTIFLT